MGVKIALVVSLLGSVFFANSQVDTNAYLEIEPMLESVFNTDSNGIHLDFDKICVNAKWTDLKDFDPERCYDKGYTKYYLNGSYQCDLGMVKLISDGKVEIQIDEIEKVMYVDSIARIERYLNLIESEKYTQEELLAYEENPVEDSLIFFQEIAQPGFSNLKFYKEELFSSEITVYVVNNKQNKLIAWKEYDKKSPESATLYVIDKATNLKNDSLPSIKISNSPLFNYEGYEVIDNRFIKY